MELVVARVPAGGGGAWEGSSEETAETGGREAAGVGVASWGPRPNLMRARESGVSLVCQP